MVKPVERSSTWRKQAHRANSALFRGRFAATAGLYGHGGHVTGRFAGAEPLQGLCAQQPTAAHALRGRRSESELPRAARLDARRPLRGLEMAPEPAFRTATLRAQDGFSDEEMEEVRIAFHAQRLDTEGSTISSAPRAKEEAEIATPAIQRHGLR